MDDCQTGEAGVFFRFAHDLRSDLRTVLTRVQLVRESSTSQLSEEDRAMLQDVLTAARDINALINAMSAYVGSSAEEGSENLRLLLRGLVLERKPELEQVGGQVELLNDLANPVPSGLKWVLRELLTNAYRFRSSERPLRVRVITRLTASSLEIDVRDNGIGVEEAYLDKIFQPFFAIHPHHQFPGFGLGLATCRRTLAAWKGSIQAERGPDEGLTVRVTVPLEKMLGSGL